MGKPGGFLEIARVGPLERVRARTLLISFTSDWIYPPEASRELRDLFEAAGREVEWHNLETTYGHDSFLLEEAVQAPIISSFLESVYGR
jgi:homoserine O-acetyltransferase